MAASVAPLFSGRDLLLPYAGTGTLFGALALFLIMGGAIGELIYATGSVDLSAHSRLLATVRAGWNVGERRGRTNEEEADV